jgi:hypothetical protein
MTKNIFEAKKISMPVFTIQSSLSDENDMFTSLSTSALLAKNEVPALHRRIADNYIIIKRIYKFQAVQSRITHQELNLLKKYDFSPLECSTIKQVNEELAYLKKWSIASNDILAKDADDIIQIRAKELKYIVASKYTSLSNEVYDGYKALERYFEEISKFNR